MKNPTIFDSLYNSCMMVQKGDVYYFIESNVTDVLHFVTAKYSLQQSDNRTSL